MEFRLVDQNLKDFAQALVVDDRLGIGVDNDQLVLFVTLFEQKKHQSIERTLFEFNAIQFQ